MWLSENLLSYIGSIKREAQYGTFILTMTALINLQSLPYVIVPRTWPIKDY